jgi:uncharacterized protein involved in exopolysaccharide biosynthesis
MRAWNLIVMLGVSLVLSQGAFSQTSPAAPKADHVRASPAYAELLLSKTELESQLSSLLDDYKEDFPKVAEIRTQLGFLNTEVARLFNVKQADAVRLTDALGKLMLRKVELETQLDGLRSRYKDEHPDVKRLKKQVDIFEAAIKEILG